MVDACVVVSGGIVLIGSVEVDVTVVGAWVDVCVVPASVVVVAAFVVDSVVIGVVEASVAAVVVTSVVPFAHGGACVVDDFVQFLVG